MPEYIVTVPMKYTYSTVVNADSVEAAVARAYDDMPCDVSAHNLYFDYAGDYEVSRADGVPIDEDKEDEDD